jgi:hypothetical protein
VFVCSKKPNLWSVPCLCNRSAREIIYKLKWLDQYRYLCAKIFRYPIKLHACNIFGLYFTTSNLYMQVQITTNNVVLREGILSVLLDEIKCRNCNCLSRFSVPSCV